jgi:alanine dehydrogenase
MIRSTKIGVLRETKTPIDRRVALTPQQGLLLLRSYPDVSIFIQPSDVRCYSDSEYRDAGFFLTEDLKDCDILIGVKEVEISTLIPNKSYLFFSHTAKKQTYNRKLLQEILKQNINLIDYEYLIDKKGDRLVAFGYWAGVIGAYKAVRAIGLRTGKFQLPPSRTCNGLDDMYQHLKNIKLDPQKILITGTGRVAKGAMQIMKVLNIKEVTPQEFLRLKFEEPVVCQLSSKDYVERLDGESYSREHFHKYPELYRSKFKSFSKRTDTFIACHFWNPKSPKFLSVNDYKDEDFRISIIADISCDINDPIPSTLRATTATSPFYDYDRFNEKEAIPFVDKQNLTVMAVDNLPGELPREASDDFGHILINQIYSALLSEDTDGIIERASITKEGKLGNHFSYLQDYVSFQN